MATRLCKICEGTGIIAWDENPGGAPCLSCEGKGQTVIPSRRDDLTPEAILDLQKTLGDVNPKDTVGKAKVAFGRLPMTAVAHASHAMMDGAKKYGPFNWRDKKVSAEVYVSAAMRHLADWFEREETAADSGAHHLGHAMACCAILLDAQESGNLLDDRPAKGASMSALLARLNAAVLEKGLHLPKKAAK